MLHSVVNILLTFSEQYAASIFTGYKYRIVMKHQLIYIHRLEDPKISRRCVARFFCPLFSVLFPYFPAFYNNVWENSFHILPNEAKLFFFYNKKVRSKKNSCEIQAITNLYSLKTKVLKRVFLLMLYIYTYMVLWWWRSRSSAIWRRVGKPKH